MYGEIFHPDTFFAQGRYLVILHFKTKGTVFPHQWYCTLHGRKDDCVDTLTPRSYTYIHFTLHHRTAKMYISDWPRNTRSSHPTPAQNPTSSRILNHSNSTSHSRQNFISGGPTFYQTLLQCISPSWTTAVRFHRWLDLKLKRQNDGKWKLNHVQRTHITVYLVQPKISSFDNYPMAVYSEHWFHSLCNRKCNKVWCACYRLAL